MPSKRSTGEVLIDHRNSPGITPEFMAKNGLDPDAAVGAGKIWESGLLNCVHCGADVVMHPLRTRAREWCWACDAYICDGCGLLKKLGAPHRPYRQILGELYDELQKGTSI